MASLFADSLTKKIPDGWISTQLGRCLDLVRNGLSFEQNQEGRGVRVTRIETISEGTINTEKVGFVETDGDISEYLLKRGDVLFSHINSIKHIGKVAQFDNDEELYHGMNLLVLQFNSKVDKRFGYYFLASRQTKSICERMAKQAVNQASINTKEIRQLPIALPPLPEQHKIAEILSTVDETIEKTDAIIQETQQLKKGLMQKLFTEGIRHTRFKETKIGKIPEEWEVVRFNQCLQKTKQKDPTKKPDEKFTYIDVSAVSNEFFKIVESKTILGKDAPSRARKGIKTGDTIYATVRPYLRRVAFVPSELDGEICSTGYCVLRPKSEEIFHRFVFQLMLTHRVNEYLESLQAGTSYPAISDSDVYQMLIPKPPLPEQRRIAEILSEVDTRIETEQAFKAELEQLKKGLMQVLLTGKVRVKV